MGPPSVFRLQRIWVARTPRDPSCPPQCLHCSLLGAAICGLGWLTTGSIASLHFSVRVVVCGAPARCVRGRGLHALMVVVGTDTAGADSMFMRFSAASRVGPPACSTWASQQAVQCLCGHEPDRMPHLRRTALERQAHSRPWGSAARRTLEAPSDPGMPGEGACSARCCWEEGRTM